MRDEEQAFEIGDVVKLKSGGPLMTVDSLPVMGEPKLNVVWFDGKRLHHAQVAAASVKKERR
jgi:uncharacterized protein YodC (DUF2158 family)